MPFRGRRIRSDIEIDLVELPMTDIGGLGADLGRGRIFIDEMQDLGPEDYPRR